jgi:ethanolaminephosphotransferase
LLRAEGLIIACILMIISGYCGPQIWDMKLKDTIGLDNSLLQDYSFRDLWVPILVGAFMFAHMPGCVYNVAVARRRQNLPVWPVFLEWIPIIVFSASCWLWLFSPNTHLLSENRLVLFCVTMSFVFGRMTTKIILAHLTKQPFPMWTHLITPLMGGALLANLPYFGL